MEVIILRHGRAEPDAAKDSQRPLTPAGREEIRRVLRRCAEVVARVDAVWVSPYLRAQQTWNEVQSEVSELAQCAAQICPFLTPGGNPQEIIDRLHRQNEAITSVLLVSHQPLLGTLLDEFCGFEPGQYRLSTGSIAAIDTGSVVAKGLGELRWIHHP